MAFLLGYGLSPQMGKKGVSHSTEDTDEVIFPRSDGLFGHVVAMFLGRDKFIGHVVCLAFDLVCH